MSFHQLAAIILAAGRSSRMGTCKALLPIGRQTVLARSIELFQTCGVNVLQVVVGHHAKEIQRALQPFDVSVVVNPDYPQGMFTSIQTGLRHLHHHTDAFFVLPVDVCLIRPLTIRLLMDAWDTYTGSIIHPRFATRRGHPPLVPMSLASVIRKQPSGVSLQTILNQYEHQAVDVDVPDRQILHNMNTPQDYETVLQQAHHQDIPSIDECEVILKRWGNLPPATLAHSRKVEQVARQLCQKLYQKLYPKLQTFAPGLDCELVSAAALLHDIARDQPNHARTGADLLRKMGFERVATIVAQHTDLTCDVTAPITAAEIVFLADKLVMDDDCTSLEDRFARALQRHGHNLQALAAINKRSASSMAVKTKLEQALGASLASIIR